MGLGIFDLSGKVAIVSGAASGMGRATAIALAEHGAKLLLIDLNEEGLKQTQTMIGASGPRPTIQICDTSDLAMIGKLFAKLDLEMGRIDFLANIAGEGILAKPENITDLLCAKKRESDCLPKETVPLSTSAHWRAIRPWVVGTSPTVWQWARWCK